MKVRTNYVSNSSSSSFVIHNFDKDNTARLMKEFINQLDFSSEDCSYYHARPDHLQLCLNEKLNSPKEEQKDWLTIYVKHNFWNFFDEVFHCYIYQRDYELSGCESCDEFQDNFDKGRFGECRSCVHLFQNKHMIEHSESIEKFKKEFREFSFDEDIEKIRSLVYSAETEVNKFDETNVKTNWSEWESFSESLAEKYFEMWKKNNPNSFVLSFASDIGNKSEAFMRCEIHNFANFMIKNGVDGFIGENS